MPRTITDHGFHVILRPTNYSNPTKEQVAHFFDRADKIQNVSGIMFVGKEVLGYTPVNAERKTMLDYTADNLNDRDIPFYMIESVNQLQYNQQDGMYDLAGLVHYRTARVYAMAKEELEKITPEEAAMRYYISDLERNARVNLYPLYKKPLHGMNLTQTNLSYVKMVSAETDGPRLYLGQGVHHAAVLSEPPAPGHYGSGSSLRLRLCPQLAHSPVGPQELYPHGHRHRLRRHRRCRRQRGPVPSGLGYRLCYAAPTAAILLALDHWKKKKITRKLGYGRVVRDGTIGLFFAVAVAMIGGLYIAAMLGNIRFFMEFDFYRGVKLTFVLPLLLVAIGYLRRFPLMGQTIASPEDLKVFVKDFLNIPIKMGTILILAVLALAGVIFVGRSGHTAGVPVPGVEVAMRRFLENVLYARPREKEFLIGHPAFYLMVAALYRKWPQLLHFFLVIAAASASVHGRNLRPYPDALPHVLHPRHQRLGDGHGRRHRIDHCHCHRQLCDDVAGKAGGPS